MEVECLESGSDNNNAILAPGMRVPFETNMTLLVGEKGTPIPVHRHLMASCSPFVELQCRKHMNLKTIRLHEYEVQDVMQLLRFVYTGEITVNENLESVMRLAKKLEIKQYFKQVISDGLMDENNVLLFMNMVDESVNRLVWDIIDSKAVQVLKSAPFRELKQQQVIEIIQRDCLAVENEWQVYEACINWALAEAKRSRTPTYPGTIRKYVEKMLPHVRFPLMDLKKLCDITDEKSTQYFKILTDKEALALFRAIHLNDPGITSFSFKPRTSYISDSQPVDQSSEASS